MGANNASFGNRRTKKGKNKYIQGLYNLENEEKYIGIMPIKYFSSWELGFCRFCDLNDRVLKWSSESLEIPYQIKNSLGIIETHRYYPDFYIEMIDNNDPERYDRFVIEIKPKHETEPPKQPQRETLKTLETYQYSLTAYKKNIHKWHFTKDWCDRHSLKFIIISEDDLKKYGIIK